MGEPEAKRAKTEQTAYRVGFLGGGMMCEAMLKGMLRSGVTRPELVTVSEIMEDRRAYMCKTYGCKVTDDNRQACAPSEVVVVAVKPQSLETVLAEVGVQAATGPLFMSIVAGKTIAVFEAKLGKAHARVARVMPNTPSLVGCGAAAYALGTNCRPEDGRVVEDIMGSLGIVERVGGESLLDAVTGLSGSGPAYVYAFIEALSDGGVRMGLPRATATRLAAQTVMGSAKMVMETGKHPGELKDAVTSPGGTTIAGMHALENGAFRGLAMNAVEASAKRSAELGKL